MMASFIADAKRLLSTKLKWSERTALEKAYTGCLVTFLVCLFPLPYEFYDFVRVIVFICLCVYLHAVYPFRKQEWGWFLLTLAFLLLYNPILPFHIGEKLVWTVINALTVWALYKARQKFADKVRASSESSQS